MTTQLAHAQRVAQELAAKLMPAFCAPGASASGGDRLFICGSIRRQRPLVKDIDLVGIPQDRSRLGLILYELTGEKLKVTGQIVRFRYQGLPVDLYLADPERLVIIALIRTGSAEHNRWLATRALAQGKRLNFAAGVEITHRGGVYAFSNPAVDFYGGFKAWTTTGSLEAGEGEIFAALGLPNIPPACRELGAPHTRQVPPLGSPPQAGPPRADARGESSPRGSDS